MNFLKYGSIFWQLFKTDLTLFQQTFWDKCLNAMIWVSTTVAITGYILPAFGLSANYGAFLAVGAVVSIGGFELYPQVASFIADHDGERHINYHLTLPIPNWLWFIKWCCSFIINTLLMTFIALVVSKAILWNQFTFAQASLWRVVLAFFVSAIFFAFFGLWVVSITKNIATMENTMVRVLYPLWFLGGFQFSWEVLHGCSSFFAYLCLLNPYIYATEGMRAAMLGQEGYLPFWACMDALLGISFLCGWNGIMRLKKRFDFIG